MPAGEKRKKRKKKAKVVSEAELMELFLGNELLSSLPEATLKELAAGQAKYSDVAPGEDYLTLKAGRTDKAPLVVILKGSMKLLSPTGDGHTVLNLFTSDEVFFDKAFDPDAALDLTLQAVQPCKLVQIPYERANAILKSDPGFKERFTAVLQAATERKQQLFDDPDVRPIAEFIGEQGLVGIQRLKVKRLDKCIDCDACFEACAERRGVSRLGDYQSTFQKIGIPYNCHNCTSPACIEACRFNHIKLVAGELVISDDCAGCSQCAKACPYDAITMLPLDVVPEGYLQRSPNAKGKRIAFKCDNCIDYEDQACISACPTGAIFQLSSKNVTDYLSIFALKSTKALEKLGWEGVIEVEKAPWVGWKVLFFTALILVTLLVGYESAGRMYLYKSRADTVVDALVDAGVEREVAEQLVDENGPEVFHKIRRDPDILVEQAELSRSKAEKVSKKFKAMKQPPWDATWRTKYYSLTATLYHLGLRSIPPEKGGPNYMRPGNHLSLLLGYLGALMMILAQLYTVRRAIGASMGSMRTWLDFHIYAGYLGGSLVFFHATYKFHGFVFWLSFVPMLIAIVTGILGRYVYFLIPRSATGRAMDSEELMRKLKDLNARIEEVLAQGRKGRVAAARAREQGLLDLPEQAETERAWWRTLLRSFGAGMKRRSRAKKLTAALRELGGLKGKAAKQLAELVDERTRLESAAAHLSSLELLTGSWRQVHIWASYLMFATMLIHTFYAWIFMGKKAFFG